MPRARQKAAWEIQLEQDVELISARLNADPEVIRAFLYEGGDEYNVPIIKKYLRTPEQKAILEEMDVSLEDVLNGRITADQYQKVYLFFADWNEKLGKTMFGA